MAKQKKKAELFCKERLWVYNYVMKTTKIIRIVTVTAPEIKKAVIVTIIKLSNYNSYYILYLSYLSYTFKTTHKSSFLIANLIDESRSSRFRLSTLGQAFDRLVTVNSTHRCASISALSTSSSLRGLSLFRVWISHLEGGFTLRCLQRLSLPGLATLLCTW